MNALASNNVKVRCDDPDWVFERRTEHTDGGEEMAECRTFLGGQGLKLHWLSAN
jgi:hypothetical protein